MLYEDYEGSRAEFLKLLAERGEEPAFLRRSRGVDSAISQLERECLACRKDMLRGPRLHLRKLAVLLHSNWKGLTPYLVDGARWVVFEQLFAECNGQKELPSWSQAAWGGSIKVTLREVYHSVARFNQAWQQYLDIVLMVILTQYVLCLRSFVQQVQV